MKKRIKLTTILFIFAVSMATAAHAQIATGGNFALQQSVIASGGGQNSTGGTFTLDGTIGQSVAGTSSNSPFVASGGFWAAAPFAPTAAGITISGRVIVSGSNQGLINAYVYLTDQSGEVRVVQTTLSGNYRFDDVAAGQTVVIAVVSRRYHFDTQVVSVTEEINNLNFFSTQ